MLTLLFAQSDIYKESINTRDKILPCLVNIETIEIKMTFNFPHLEMSNQPHYSLSSFKPGYGTKQLLSEKTDDFWQSDGPQPHFINIQFRKRTTVISISLYIDFKQDESYAPKIVSIRGGTSFDNLHELLKKDLHEPNGWITLDLERASCFCMQVMVLQNHQNGKDTHIRGIRVQSVQNEE
jgi:anaphase-promoting complex subunit 10